MCLPSQLDLRATRCGGLWHRRCRRAGPGPGGTQDEGQEQQLESDGEAVEVGVGPGLAGRVVHRDVDVEEHQAGPGRGELRSDRYRRIVQCCRGLGVCAQGSLHRVEGGCAWIGPHIITAISAVTERTKSMRLIVHHLLCWAIPSGSLYWLER